MCEQFVARADAPFTLDDLWPYAERLERFGLGGFGWGVAWLDGAGTLRTHRDVRAFHDDPARDALGSIETTSALVHLRRPSRLSTLTLADTQPFDDPAGRYALSHNGDFKDIRALRRGFQAAGRIHGRADTEVGARWLEDRWVADRPIAPQLAALHAELGGQANLAVLTPDGTVCHHAGNSENPVFAFRLGRIGIAGTGLYSLDRSVFRYAAPGATDRRLVRVGTAVTSGRDGRLMAVE